MTSVYGPILEVRGFSKEVKSCAGVMMVFLISGDPLYVGFDLTIASFDSISEVSMVRIDNVMHLRVFVWILNSNVFLCRIIQSRCI